jgi:hypothetical protein
VTDDRRTGVDDAPPSHTVCKKLDVDIVARGVDEGRRFNVEVMQAPWTRDAGERGCCLSERLDPDGCWNKGSAGDPVISEARLARVQAEVEARAIGEGREASERPRKRPGIGRRL